MFISRDKYRALQASQCTCNDRDARDKIKEDLMDINNLVGKAYLRLNNTKYWVDEGLDDISSRIEDIMYELATHEVFDD